MPSRSMSARRLWATWLALVAGVALMLLPALEARAATAAFACLIMGGVVALSAAIAMIINPSWGLSVQAGVIRWWHEPRHVDRSVAVDEVQLVRVIQSADVLELDTAESTFQVPRECVRVSARQWATELHQAFPHIELRVEG